MFTRCPKCQTAFRIHAKQLGAASGLVRCGSCQYIFQALEHLFELTPGNSLALLAAKPSPMAAPVPPVAKAAAVPPPAAIPPQAVAPEVRMADEAVLPPPIIIRAGLAASGAPRREPGTENLPPKAAPKPVPASEPSMAEVPPATPAPTAANEFDFTRARFSRVAPPPDVAFETPEIDYAALERDNTEIANMLAEIEARMKEQPAGTMPAADPVTLVETMEPTPEVVHAAQVHIPTPTPTQAIAEAAPGISEALTQVEQRENLSFEGAPTPDEPAPESVLPEPVFDLRQKKRARLPLLWPAAVLLLIVGIFAQLVYFNRDGLARQPQLRPLMEQMCGFMGCTIPLRVDLNAFELSDRDVRTHPQQAGQLLVSATIKNNAAYPQPYPVIELSFRSIEGQLIIKHLFKPNDYVGKNLSLDNGIASQQTLRLSMAIPDPGPTAINFLFDFLPAPENQP